MMTTARDWECFDSSVMDLLSAVVHARDATRAGREHVPNFSKFASSVKTGEAGGDVLAPRLASLVPYNNV